MGAYQIVRFIIYSLLDILSLMIVVRALYKVYNVLALITNPILEPVRRLLQKVPALARMPVDFSPVVVLLLISVLRMIL